MTPAAGEQAARALLYRLGPEHFTDRALLAWARSQATRARYRLARAGDACRSAGRAPVFPLKAADFITRGVEKGPALGAALARRKRPGSRRGFPSDAATIAAIADAAANPPPA